MKISLGTVQFGTKYGINNKNGIPSNQELLNIFTLAQNNHIKFLDTALAYGDAEKRVGQFFRKGFNVTSKFPYCNSQNELKDSLASTPRNLDFKNIYGYLAHNAYNLISVPELWDTLQEFKEKNIISKIGYSIYSVEELNTLLEKKFIPDIVQVPFSILDRRFESKIKMLKNIGVEVHIRSIFLQGIFFINFNDLPNKLQAFKPAIIELKKICNDFAISIESLALNYCIQNKNVDQVLVGVETEEQLKKNLNAYNNCVLSEEIFERINSISFEDDSILNPSNW